MEIINLVKDDLKKYSNPENIKTVSRFFKTGKGEYGEGDIFLGIKVPDQRKVVSKYYKSISLEEVEFLLKSEIHEFRLCSLLFLEKIFTKKNELKETVVNIYLRNLKFVNNWDLVDTSAHKILGVWFKNRDRSLIYELAASKSLWNNRIAIITTFAFIKENDFKDTLIFAEKFISHEHDLIHKAVGWMLREIGNRDLQVEIEFLNKFYKKMPRVMLRYAIEKFDDFLRKAYLKGKI